MLIIVWQRYDTVRQHPNGHSSLPIPELNEESILPTAQKTDETQAGTVPPDRPSTPPADFTVAREDSQEEPAADHSGADVADTIYIQPPVITELEPTPDQRADAELLAKYQAAQAEIERLHALLAEVPSSPPNELRRRNQPLSDDGSTVGETEGGTGVEDPLQPEGVPLQVVVIIALGVFITTYLFF
jgi:vesicle-associated membrane protein-associated protein A